MNNGLFAALGIVLLDELGGRGSGEREWEEEAKALNGTLRACAAFRDTVQS